MASRSIVPTQSGALIESDEQSIEYLLVLNSELDKRDQFILHHLDSQHLFVKADSMNKIYESLQKRLSKTVWDEEAAAAVAAEKALRSRK